MTFPQFFLIFIVAIPLVLVSLDRLRMDIAALFIAACLGLAQFFGLAILSAKHNPHDAIKAIAGFSQPVVITLLSLFIITTSLDKSGLTRWVARKILKIGGSSERLFIALFTTTTALLSLIMNNLAAGALLLPSAMEVARRSGIKPSKLLIPVAYGSLLGGAATYFTGANILVSDLLTTANPPQHALHILDFTPTGGLIAILGIIFLTIFGPRWLPEREPAPEQMIARPTGRELEDHYRIVERLWEVVVPADSPITNKSLAESAIG
ncbi:MAG: SLC13 family permease, partial [Anaerolineales bacterium]